MNNINHIDRFLNHSSFYEYSLRKSGAQIWTFAVNSKVMKVYKYSGKLFNVSFPDGIESSNSYTLVNLTEDEVLFLANKLGGILDVK